MKRRRFFPIIALVMLLASLLSTETAEVWCRVAAGATMDADDDDGLYFSCRHQADPADSGRPTFQARSASVLKYAIISVGSHDGSVVDEPTFSLGKIGMAVIPGFFLRTNIATQNVAYAAGTRGPPMKPARFTRPPPRGPPVS